MKISALKTYLPWSLQGMGPILNKYGDKPLFGAIRRTPPISVNPGAETGIHTAVPHRYVFAYLVAIKSFLRYHADVAVYVHDDGSLREGDKLLIKEHLPGVTVVDRGRADQMFDERVGDPFLAKVRTSYTSYLKLFDPSLVSTNRRIVIVDTDVLFLAEPEAVIQWVKQGGTAWYHKSEPWKKKADAHSPIQKAAGSDHTEKPTHIQQLVVQSIPDINQALGMTLRFDPGFNSGFIGYDRGTVDYEELKRLLTHLYGMFGDRIFRWGAEQTMHGLTMCGKGAVPLPSDRYMVFTDLNCARASQAAFVHFIGEYRYHRLIYPRLAAKTIRSL